LKIIQSKKYERKASKLVAGNKQLLDKLLEVYKMMEEDLFNPKLKTHKLKGEFRERWSCSLTYDLRIIFRIKEHDKEKVIELLTMGSHDMVY